MTQSLRIGFDGTPLLGHRSGVGYYTSRLLSALVQDNPDWEYLLYSNRPLGPLEPPLSQVQQVARYFPRSRWVWMQTILPRTIRQSQPHLCHFTNALAPLRQPRPYILTVHDASLFVYGQYHPWARHLTIRLTLPIAVRRAAAVIAVSEHARQELLRVLQAPAGKIHVVHEAAPNGLQPLVSPTARAALRHKYHLPDEYLLYVGTLEPRKNLSRLIRALKQVRAAGHRHRLVLVGPQGWMMQNFRKEIAAEDMTDAVQFLGYVPTADLPGLYSLATLFVFPSLYEGFGLPPLEAMACGTPVVSSNRSSLAEICGDAAHLVNPEDTPQIAQALCELLEDPARRAALGQRGLARAKTFSWQRAAQETAAIYRQVAAAS